jgi:ammonia channel protein AmtB
LPARAGLTVPLRQAFVIGSISALVRILGDYLLDRCGVDDPAGAVGLHAAAGAWSLLSVGYLPPSCVLLGADNAAGSLATRPRRRGCPRRAGCSGTARGTSWACRCWRWW